MATSQTKLAENEKDKRVKWVTGVATMVACVGYAGYYLTRCAVRPELHYKEDSDKPPSLIAQLARAVPSLNARYFPPFWGTNAHVNTAVSTYLRSLPSSVAYRRVELRAEDGGRVYVDWARPLDLANTLSSSSSPSSPTTETTTNVASFSSSFSSSMSASSLSGSIPSALNKNHPGLDEFFAGVAARTPTLVICAGLNGGSGSVYVMHLAEEALRAGLLVCCLNNRGSNATPLHTPKTYCGAFTDDIRLAMAHVRERRGRAHVVAAGFSLGANMLTKFVAEECRKRGEEGRETLEPSAAVVISNPWDFHEASRALRGVPAFDKVMAEGLVKQFKQHYRSVGWDSHPELDVGAILHDTKSVHAFDEQVTRRVWGYGSVDEYYTDASSCRYLQHVDVPLVAINALDDPLIPPSAIPFAAFRDNPSLLLVTTPCGGHVGFAEGLLPLGDISSWAERLAVECLQHVIALSGPFQ